jgi:hypothetical protein
MQATASAGMLECGARIDLGNYFAPCAMIDKPD